MITNKTEQHKMINICKIQILEILDDSFYPGICRAVLEDYYNHKHFFVDKVPVLGGVHIDEISQFPFEGYMRVEVINDLGDSMEINTEKPDDIELENGCYRFIVLKEKIKIP